MTKKVRICPLCGEVSIRVYGKWTWNRVYGKWTCKKEGCENRGMERK